MAKKKNKGRRKNYKPQKQAKTISQKTSAKNCPKS